MLIYNIFLFYRKIAPGKYIEKMQMLKKLFVIPIFLISVLFVVTLVISVFLKIPIESTTLGLDWKTIWEAIRQGQITYGNHGMLIGGMYTPPWGIMFLLPLGYLSFRVSWGLLTLFSIIILIISVPKVKEHQLDVAGILLLVLSFPSLRNMADGNLEAVVIGGILLLVGGFSSASPWMFALGLVLSSIKLQETWLFILILVALVGRRWDLKQCIKLGGIVFVIGGVSMLLWGKKWLNALFYNSSQKQTIVIPELASQMGRGSMIDITLKAALERLGFPTWFVFGFWLVMIMASMFLVIHWLKSTEKISNHVVTLCLSAGILLAPYASGDSFLTIVAIGIIPLFQKNRYLGVALLSLVYIPYLASKSMLYNYQSYYWTLLLLICWIISFISIRLDTTNHLVTHQ